MHPFKKKSLIENITNRPLFFVKVRSENGRFVGVSNIEQNSFASLVKPSNKLTRTEQGVDQNIHCKKGY